MEPAQNLRKRDIINENIDENDNKFSGSGKKLKLTQNENKCTWSTFLNGLFN